MVAHEVYGEDAIRVTPPPPQALHSNTSCLMNPSTPPQNATSLMHDRIMHQSSDSIESNLGPNGHIMQFPQHGFHGATNINNDLIPVSYLLNMNSS